MSRKPQPPGDPSESLDRDVLPSVEHMNAKNTGIPFNAWLGAKVIDASAAGVRLHVPWRTEFAGAPGMTHGGILAAIVDLAAYSALKAAGGDGGPTIDMRVDYHRSTVNGPFYAESKVVRAGSTISTAEVVIRDAEERLIASGRCVFLSRSRRLAPSP
jgi:uncharacterized protein (TIGR00369 family)